MRHGVGVVYLIVVNTRYGRSAVVVRHRSAHRSARHRELQLLSLCLRHVEPALQRRQIPRRLVDGQGHLGRLFVGGAAVYVGHLQCGFVSPGGEVVGGTDLPLRVRPVGGDGVIAPPCRRHGQHEGGCISARQRDALNRDVPVCAVDDQDVDRRLRRRIAVRQVREMHRLDGDGEGQRRFKRRRGDTRYAGETHPADVVRPKEDRIRFIRSGRRARLRGKRLPGVGCLKVIRAVFVRRTGRQVGNHHLRTGGIGEQSGGGCGAARREGFRPGGGGKSIVGGGEARVEGQRRRAVPAEGGERAGVAGEDGRPCLLVGTRELHTVG